MSESNSPIQKIRDANDLIIASKNIMVGRTDQTAHTSRKRFMDMAQRLYRDANQALIEAQAQTTEPTSAANPAQAAQPQSSRGPSSPGRRSTASTDQSPKSPGQA